MALRITAGSFFGLQQPPVVNIVSSFPPACWAANASNAEQQGSPLDSLVLARARAQLSCDGYAAAGGGGRGGGGVMVS